MRKSTKKSAAPKAAAKKAQPKPKVIDIDASLKDADWLKPSRDLPWRERIVAAVRAGRGTLADLDKLPGANPDSIRWYASKMTAAGQLKRVSVGNYAIPKKSAKKAAK